MSKGGIHFIGGIVTWDPHSRYPSRRVNVHAARDPSETARAGHRNDNSLSLTDDCSMSQDRRSYELEPGA